ncbi:hypothetical protein C8Q73DRAFT_685962 [Cubamyces lactineus]|nr:hypothetical protein C8Q73DRAFT_685962 [Cubamyces lactineus]
MTDKYVEPLTPLCSNAIFLMRLSSASSMAHPVRAELRNVDSASHQPSAAPFTPLGILARDAVDDGCRSALGMLERDYTGHGLPLTSLVIESSTLLLLVVFVVYFVVGRCRVRREHLRLFTPTPTLSQPSTASRDSIAKTITLTPPPPLLSKIDEDSHSSGPTHPSHIQLSPPSPPQTPLSPQRGPPPASPSRAIFRSPSCTNVSTATARSGLEKKASFLSLKG